MPSWRSIRGVCVSLCVCVCVCVCVISLCTLLHHNKKRYAHISSSIKKNAYMCITQTREWMQKECLAVFLFINFKKILQLLIRLKAYIFFSSHLYNTSLEFTFQNCITIPSKELILKSLFFLPHTSRFFSK